MCGNFGKGLCFNIVYQVYILQYDVIIYAWRGFRFTMLVTRHKLHVTMLNIKQVHVAHIHHVDVVSTHCLFSSGIFSSFVPIHLQIPSHYSLAHNSQSSIEHTHTYPECALHQILHYYGTCTCTYEAGHAHEQKAHA